MKRSMLVVIMVLFSLQAVFAEPLFQSDDGEGEVVGAVVGRANVRETPSTRGALVTELLDGETVTILARERGEVVFLQIGSDIWYRARLEDGTEGYIWSGLIEIIEGELPETISQREPTPVRDDQDVAQLAWARFGHFAPNLPRMDFYVDGEQVTSLAFMEVTGREDFTLSFSFAGGTHEFVAVPVGDPIDSSRGLTLAVTLQVGESYFIGALEDSEAGLVIVNETAVRRALEGDAAQNEEGTTVNVLVWNLLQDAPVIDIIGANGALLIDDLPPTGFSGFASGDEASVQVTAGDDPDALIIEELAIDDFLPELEYLLILSGTSNNSEALIAAGNTATLEGLLRESAVSEILKLILDESGLMERLRSDSGFTFFAPTDEALLQGAAELGITVRDLLADPSVLMPILENHFVNEFLPPQTLQTDESLLTMAGEEITISIEGDNLTLAAGPLKANILQFVVGRNGGSYVIDRLLIPASLE